MHVCMYVRELITTFTITTSSFMAQGALDLRALAYRGSIGKDDIILLNFGVWFQTKDKYAKALTAFKDDYESLYFNRFTHHHPTTKNNNLTMYSIHVYVEKKSFAIVDVCT